MTSFCHLHLASGFSSRNFNVQHLLQTLWKLDVFLSQWLYYMGYTTCLFISMIKTENLLFIIVLQVSACKNHLHYRYSNLTLKCRCEERDSNYVFPFKDYGLVTSVKVNELGVLYRPNEYVVIRGACDPMLGRDFDTDEKRNLSNLTWSLLWITMEKCNFLLLEWFKFCLVTSRSWMHSIAKWRKKLEMNTHLRPHLAILWVWYYFKVLGWTPTTNFMELEHVPNLGDATSSCWSTRSREDDFSDPVLQLVPIPQLVVKEPKWNLTHCHIHEGIWVGDIWSCGRAGFCQPNKYKVGREPCVPCWDERKTLI